MNEIPHGTLDGLWNDRTMTLFTSVRSNDLIAATPPVV